jgi:hypothetical protein
MIKVGLPATAGRCDLTLTDGGDTGSYLSRVDLLMFSIAVAVRYAQVLSVPRRHVDVASLDHLKGQL